MKDIYLQRKVIIRHNQASNFIQTKYTHIKTGNSFIAKCNKCLTNQLSYYRPITLITINNKEKYL